MRPTTSDATATGRRRRPAAPPLQASGSVRKTRNGDSVGDLFVSLISTCQMNQANPFDYLTRLQRHAEAVAASPGRWMPWNYRVAPA